MRSATLRVSAFVVLALGLGSCADPPLSPDQERVSPSAQGTLTAPSNLAATARSSSRIDLAWRDQSTNETGFEVHRSINGVNGPYLGLAVTGAGFASYSDEGVASSTAYCYRIRAFRITGNKKSYSAFSGAACATTPAPPPPPGPKNPPSGLVAVTAGTVVTLTWADNSGDEEGFRIERSAGASGPWVLRFSTGANAISTGDGEAFPELELCYRIIAFNRDGNSAPSNVDCTTPVFAPSGLSASKVDDATIEVSWTNSSKLADAVEVSRLTADGWSLIATLAATATVYRDAGLTPNSTYLYSLRARRQDDASSYSYVNGSTGTVPPEAAFGLLAYPGSSTSVNLWWQHNSPNASGQRLEQSQDGGASWRTMETLGPGGGYWFIQNAVMDQVVCYRLILFNAAGDSPPSDFVCTAPPAPATELTVTHNADGTADISWRDNSNVEDGYYILRGYDWDSQLVAEVGPNVTTVRDLFPDPSYPCYVVTPTRDGGSGDRLMLC